MTLWTRPTRLAVLVLGTALVATAAGLHAMPPQQGACAAVQDPELASLEAAYTAAYKDYVYAIATPDWRTYPTPQTRIANTRAKLGEAEKLLQAWRRAHPGPATTGSVIAPAAIEVQAAAASVQFSTRLCRSTPQGWAAMADTPVVVSLEGFEMDSENGATAIDKHHAIDAGSGPVPSGPVTGHTDGDGRLSLTYISPIISSPGFVRGRVTLRIAAAGGVEARAAITLTPPGVRGRVVSWDPFQKKDVPAPHVPLRVKGGTTNVTITSSAGGTFAVAAATGERFQILVGNTGAKWSWTDPVDFIEDNVTAPATLTLVYDRLAMHYARAAGAERRLLEWFETMSRYTGLRGFNNSWDELLYRKQVAEGTHLVTRELGLKPQGTGLKQETNNDPRIIDWFAAHSLGYIGRCGDVSMYIMREFARRFKDDREMGALALVELSIDNGEYIPVVGWNHVAPMIVPSIVFKATRRVGVLYDTATGEISPDVKVSAFVLDAYDANRGRVVKTYAGFKEHYQIVFGLVNTMKVDLPSAPR
jgi:hypothetical protein